MSELAKQIDKLIVNTRLELVVERESLDDNKDPRQDPLIKSRIGQIVDKLERIKKFKRLMYGN